MKFSGAYRIDAPRARVWEAINDPQILARCLPGCEEIVRDTPTDWTARVVARVGPVKARFTGRIRLEDLDPPAACRIVGEGSGGPAGFAQGSANVRLAEDGPEATTLAYDADAQIGGKLAQIGSRLIDSFARRYADDFFAAFARVVGGGDEAAGGIQPINATPTAVDEPLGATAVLASAPSPAPLPSHRTDPSPVRRFDAQSFTIVVLALLLVFMTIMFALKP